MNFVCSPLSSFFILLSVSGQQPTPSAIFMIQVRRQNYYNIFRLSLLHVMMMMTIMGMCFKTSAPRGFYACYNVCYEDMII